MFKQVHGKKNGHWGTAKTWRELNIHYPGHGLTYKKIETLVAECPDCQKHRIAKSTLVLAPSAAVLQPPDDYNTVSRDGFKVQEDDDGYCWINICHYLGTSYISLFPSKPKDAGAAADALLQLRATTGRFRYLQPHYLAHDHDHGTPLAAPKLAWGRNLSCSRMTRHFRWTRHFIWRNVKLLRQRWYNYVNNCQEYGKTGKLLTLFM